MNKRNYMIIISCAVVIICFIALCFLAVLGQGDFRKLSDSIKAEEVLLSPPPADAEDIPSGAPDTDSNDPAFDEKNSPEYEIINLSGAGINSCP